MISWHRGLEDRTECLWTETLNYYETRKREIIGIHTHMHGTILFILSVFNNFVRTEEQAFRFGGPYQRIDKELDKIHIPQD